MLEGVQPLRKLDFVIGQQFRSDLLKRLCFWFASFYRISNFTVDVRRKRLVQLSLNKPSFFYLWNNVNDEDHDNDDDDVDDVDDDDNDFVTPSQEL